MVRLADTIGHLVNLDSEQGSSDKLSKTRLKTELGILRYLCSNNRHNLFMKLSKKDWINILRKDLNFSFVLVIHNRSKMVTYTDFLQIQWPDFYVRCLRNYKFHNSLKDKYMALYFLTLLSLKLTSIIIINLSLFLYFYLLRFFFVIDTIKSRNLAPSCFN